MALKCQQFEDNESGVIKPWALKCLFMDLHDNEKRQGLNNKYVPLLFHSQKSNRSTDLDERTNNLNHLVYLPKLLFQIIANFALEFLGRKGLKIQKKSILAVCKRG